jgi:hypothetical protein
LISRANDKFWKLYQALPPDIKKQAKESFIPYDQTNSQLVPVTVHSTSRQQLRFRLKTGRFIREQA